MPQSSAKVKLPVPPGMEFIVRKMEYTSDPMLDQCSTIAWRWSTKKKKQYGYFYTVTETDENSIERFKQLMLSNFWRSLGAA